MIEYFKIGYYYKFIGNENDYIWWDYDRKLLLNGKWHKCIYSNEYSKHYAYAKFEGMKKDWFWNKKDFIESKHSPKEKVKKLLKEI